MRWGSVLKFTLFGLFCAAASACLAQIGPYMNVTVGAPLSPGVYGRIEIGRNRAPPIRNASPIVAGPRAYGAQPMYLYVSDFEFWSWSRSCDRYQACGLPVYFVRVDRGDPWWERGSLNATPRGRFKARWRPTHD